MDEFEAKQAVEKFKMDKLKQQKTSIRGVALERILELRHSRIAVVILSWFVRLWFRISLRSKDLWVAFLCRAFGADRVLRHIREIGIEYLPFVLTRTKKWKKLVAMATAPSGRNWSRWRRLLVNQSRRRE